MTRWLFFGGLLGVLLLPFCGTAQQLEEAVLVIDPGDQAYTEGLYTFQSCLYIFPDSSTGRTINEVSSAPFQSFFYKDSTGVVGTFGGDMGHAIQYVWARLHIVSRLEQEEDWLVNISAGEIEGFVSSAAGGFVHYHSGTFVPFSKRAFGGRYGMLPCLPLRLPANDTVTVFFRLQGLGAKFGNAIMSDFDQAVFLPDVYFAKERGLRFYHAFYIGILLAVAIYHLIIFLFQRQYVTLFFGIYVMSLVVILLEFGGYFQEIFGPENPTRYGTAVVAFTWLWVNFFQYFFSRKYLQLPQILPLWDRAWAVLLLVHLISAILLIRMVMAAGGLPDLEPGPFFRLVFFRVLLGIIMLLFSVVAAVRALMKGQKAAVTYLIAMSPFIAQDLARLLAFSGILYFPPWFFGDWATIAMVLLFALGIARQLKTLQDEKTAAEQAEHREHEESLRLKELDAFKTRFYTNITHQLRTPLTIILGMTDQIREQPATWLDKGLDMIRRSGRRLLYLINQLLDLSKLEAGQMPVQLVQNDVVAYLKYNVESFFSWAHHKHIHLHFSTRMKELIMDYDPGKLTDIVSNLLSNALQYTPEGGAVQVVVESTSDMLIIRVKDNGPGISRADLPRVFDRFYQAHTMQGDQHGSGIGLALTRELVYLLNGTITVESEPGMGTEFSVALPVTRSAPQGPRYTSVELHKAVSPYLHQSEPVTLTDTGAGVSSQPTVLIVEDNTDVVTYITALLHNRFNLKVAGDGKQGLAIARKNIPDLIISDIMMPEMDGLELCKQLKTDIRTSHIPVILLTAKSDPASKIEGLQTGADAYLAKPFNKTELLIRIDKLIETRKQLQAHYSDLRFLFQSGSVPEHTSPDELFIQELHRIVGKNLDNPDFSIDQLCKQLGMSRAVVYKKFKALTNQAVADFIRKVRLYKAMQLLQGSDRTVTEISQEVGFRNLATFSRDFTEEFGLNPREVKRG